MNIPKVSVIIPSYNHDCYIKSSIESILNQTYTDYEIIISDDHSTDRTVEIANQFKDNRIKIFSSTKNHGSAYNANYCVSQARGSFIALLNSDDEWVTTKLQKQLQIINETSVAAVFSEADFIDHNGHLITSYTGPYNDRTFSNKNKTQAEWLHQFYKNGNSLCHPSILIKTDVLKSLPRYDNRLRQLPDFKMWIELVKRNEIYVSNEKLVRFRLLPNEQNASSGTPENVKRTNAEAFLILKNFFEGVSPELFKKAFFNEIINKTFKTQEEFYCEKAFVLLNSQSFSSTASKLIGYQMLNYGLEDIKTSKTLIESYGFDEKEFQLSSRMFESSVPADIHFNQIYFNKLPARMPISELNTRELIKYTYLRILDRLRHKIGF